MRRGGHRGLSPRLFGPLGRGGPGQGPRGVGPISRYTWIGLLTVAVLLGTALSCKQVKEVAMPGPDSDAAALYVLKILNIQPDDIDMNTEGTASATISRSSGTTKGDGVTSNKRRVRGFPRSLRRKGWDFRFYLSSAREGGVLDPNPARQSGVGTMPFEERGGGTTMQDPETLHRRYLLDPRPMHLIRWLEALLQANRFEDVVRAAETETARWPDYALTAYPFWG